MEIAVEANRDNSLPSDWENTPSQVVNFYMFFMFLKLRKGLQAQRYQGGFLLVGFGFFPESSHSKGENAQAVVSSRLRG